MCGIAGWLNLDNKDTNHNAEPVLHSMCERIVHRGPNSEGLWLDDTVALGMRRLSIIDLETGDQPVFNCDKSVIVMMNGELYNYREVRADLETIAQETERVRKIVKGLLDFSRQTELDR